MPLFSLQTLKKVFSPPLLGFLAGLALIMANIKLPDFLLTSFQYVGNMATPLSLMVIGIEMTGISLASVRWDRDIIGALVGRFLVCPACVLVLLPFIPVTPMSAQVFTMQASMPAMTQMTVVAKSVGADVRYSTEVSFITVVMALKMYMTAIPAIIITVGEAFFILATDRITIVGISENMNALITIAY